MRFGRCRRGVTSETTLSLTSFSSSPTVWRCMLTPCRDSTKPCWMTSHRWSHSKKKNYLFIYFQITSCTERARFFMLSEYIYFHFSAATSGAGGVLVHRRVRRPAGVRPVWGGGTHSSKYYTTPSSFGLRLSDSLKNCICTPCRSYPRPGIWESTVVPSLRVWRALVCSGRSNDSNQIAGKWDVHGAISKFDCFYLYLNK